MQKTIKHLMYVPFTGLGLHNGFRGNTWLKNRIKIFKQFVVPSLMGQSNQDFIIWISWRREERNNPLVKELESFLRDRFEIGQGRKVLFTYAGVCFYDDKYEHKEAHDRLVTAIHGSLPSLFDVLGECEYVYMTIQPSDDLYHKDAVKYIQKVLENPKFFGVGYKEGYICNYNTLKVAEYNPTTNPPFYTIKFPKRIFTDPLAHAEFTALKKDSGKYKAGTPCPSHEYVGACVPYAVINDLRGFLVGTHGANISTTFDIPFKGREVSHDTLIDFNIAGVLPLRINLGLGKKLLLKMPYKVQRKLRYISLEWKFLQLSTWPGLIK